MKALALLWSLGAVAAGAAIAVQAPINARFAHLLGAPVPAAFFSFLAGTVALGILAVVTVAASGASVDFRAPPPWMFVAGGLLGIGYVSAGVLLTPRIGVGALVALAVAGQLIAGLLLDRAGFMGMAVHDLTWTRIVGAAFLVLGAVMVRFL